MNVNMNVTTRLLTNVILILISTFIIMAIDAFTNHQGDAIYLIWFVILIKTFAGIANACYYDQNNREIPVYAYARAVAKGLIFMTDRYYKEYRYRDLTWHEITARRRRRNDGVFQISLSMI